MRPLLNIQTVFYREKEKNKRASLLEPVSVLKATEYFSGLFGLVISTDHSDFPHERPLC